MRKPSAGLTPECLPSLLLSGFSCLIFALLGWWPVALAALLLFAFSLHFFRDPERVTPSAPGLAISPADGKVIRIEVKPDPLTGQPRRCISIFMNVFSVHVNRMPVSGVITRILYIPGKFFNVALDKAVDANERCCYAIRDENGEEWHMMQIAGLVARRIVCRVDEGESLKRGERYGMIKFGSRVDMYLPPSYTPSVLVGEKVYAGQSVIAHLAGPNAKAVKGENSKKSAKVEKPANAGEAPKTGQRKSTRPASKKEPAAPKAAAE